MPLFLLPDPGEGLVEAEIVTWKVKQGDTVATNDVVVEIETAKSLVELPIPYDGVVRELLAAEGDVVEVGTAIIDILTSTPDRAPETPPESAAAPAREANLVGYGPTVSATTRRRRKGSDGPSPKVASEPAKPGALATPPVRKYAKDRGVDLQEVQPASADGILTRQDIDAHVASVAVVAEPTPPTSGRSVQAHEPVTAAQISGPRETRTAIKGVRKVIANAMVESAFTAPHVTEFVTVDVSATMDLLARLTADREQGEVKVGPLVLLAKAVMVAVRRNPGVNAVWDGAAGEIVQHHYVNLGIAAATPRGLIVPNIKDADRMTVRELATQLRDLVDTARSGGTQPAQMSGGTITITNVGVFGVDAGTPIINPGESAIICFGAIRRQPWVVTDVDGAEAIEPRWVTQVSLSFDHRVIDGELGSRFLADVAALLHDPARAMIWG